MDYYTLGTHHYAFSSLTLLLILVLAVWSLAWKGVALWKAGRNNQPAWFIIMLILNTAGILEIVYIFFFSKKNNDS